MTVPPQSHRWPNDLRNPKPTSALRPMLADGVSRRPFNVRPQLRDLRDFVSKRFCMSQDDHRTVTLVLWPSTPFLPIELQHIQVEVFEAEANQLSAEKET